MPDAPPFSLLSLIEPQYVAGDLLPNSVKDVIAKLTTSDFKCFSADTHVVYTGTALFLDDLKKHLTSTGAKFSWGSRVNLYKEDEQRSADIKTLNFADNGNYRPLFGFACSKFYQ